jgi:copper chaperone CopZ
VQKALGSIPGVQLTSVQIGQASLQYDPGQYAPEAIAEVVTKSGYKAQVVAQ